MFRDYAHRAAVFADAVAKLPGASMRIGVGHNGVAQ
jgi:hypothetical protein